MKWNDTWLTVFVVPIYARAHVCVRVYVSNIQKVAIQNTVAKQFLKNEEKKLFVNFYFKQ